MPVKAFRLFAAVASAAVIVVLFAGTTVGTPGSAVISAPILARGDFIDRVRTIHAGHLCRPFA